MSWQKWSQLLEMSRFTLFFLFMNAAEPQDGCVCVLIKAEAQFRENLRMKLENRLSASVIAATSRL